MPEAPTEVAALVYVCGVLLAAFVAAIAVQHGYRRTGARIALLALVWPILLAVGIVLGARGLWRMSEWGIRDDEPEAAEVGYLEATVDVSETDEPDLVHGVMVGPRCFGRSDGVRCQLTRYHRGAHTYEGADGLALTWINVHEGGPRG